MNEFYREYLYVQTPKCFPTGKVGEIRCDSGRSVKKDSPKYQSDINSFLKQQTTPPAAGP